MYRKYLVLLFALLQGSVLNAQHKVSQQHLAHPLVPDHVADPSVVSFDGQFYLYGTTDINMGLQKGGAPVVWKSADFVNWHFEGLLELGVDWNRAYFFKDKDGKDKTGYFRYWAPGNVIKKDKQFYLYVTIVKPDDQLGTYVLKADQPEGPFKFTNGTGIYFNDPINAATETKPLLDDIDGDPFVDDDGQAYIYWRRRKAAAMNSDLISMKGAPLEIPTKFKGYSEGPGLFKRNGIYYYFYTLSGHASYSNGYMISRKGPLGPFENPAGKNIFIYSNPEKGIWGPGHGNVFHLPGTDAYYFVYLEYGEGGTTRQVYANRIYFNEDGTLKPMVPDQQGVGKLTDVKDKRGINIARLSKVTASSVRLSREVEGTVTADEDSKLANPNVAERKVKRTFDYQPANAADESNATRWNALADDKSPWIMFDLGKVHKISSCEISFALPTVGHSWVLEKSADGIKWENEASQITMAIRSPHVVSKSFKARYLRVRITGGEPGLWEMKIFSKN